MAHFTPASSLPLSSPASRRAQPSCLAPLSRHLVIAGLLACPLGAWAQAAVGTLPEVRVDGEAEQDTARGTVTRINANEMANQGAGSMADVVRYQPLVSAPGIASGSGNVWDGSGNAGYNIRGMDGNRVTIEIDGIALPPAENKPDGQQNNSFTTSRDTIEPEFYEYVEIEAGATASGRGGANGQAGRVRFVTKSPENLLTPGKRSHLGYKLGYLSSNKSWMHALTGAASIGQVQALGIYVRRDGKEEKSSGTVQPNRKDWDSNALLAKFVWGANTHSRLGLALEHFDRGTDLTNDSRQNSSTPLAPNQDAKERRSRLSLEYRYAPDGLAAFDVLDSRIHYQRSESRTDTRVYVPPTARAPRAYDRNIHTNSEHDGWGLSADASKLLGNHRLFYGFSFARTHSERPWEEQRVYRDNGQTATTVKDRASSATDTRISLYARDEIGFSLGGRRATLTPGLTVQHDRLKPTGFERYALGSPGSVTELKDRSDTAYLPSLNFSLELQPGFHTYAQYSRGVRQPTISELTGSYENPTTGYAILGNPDLEKESSDNLELGVRGTPTPGVTLSASVFYSRYKNYIEYTNVGTDPTLPQFRLFLYRADNIGKARIWGTELSSRFELGQWAPAAKGLSLSLAGGWSQGNATNTVTGEKAALASVLPAKVVVGVAYDDPGQRFGAALHTTWVRSKQAAANDVLLETTTEYFKVPSYTTLDLTGYWNIHRSVTWRFGIYNLTDRRYWDYASVRGLAANAFGDIQRQARPGRTFGTSLEVKF